jgi:hypothetical protein
VALEKVALGQSAQGPKDPPEISYGDGKERIKKIGFNPEFYREDREPQGGTCMTSREKGSPMLSKDKLISSKWKGHQRNSCLTIS